MSDSKNNADLIKMIKTNDKIGLEHFYNEQRQSFVAWASRSYDCDQDTIIDVFQDAVVTLYFNIKENKVVDFNHTAEAYLFGIAKNLLLKRNIKNKKTKLVDGISESLTSGFDYEIYNKMDRDHFKHELEEAFRLMQTKCKEIIYLYYYDKNSLESIAEKLEYNNTDTVKARKNQCMKKLKILLYNKI